MAKEVKEAVPAVQIINPSAPKAEKPVLTEVVGEKQDLVKVFYLKDNHHNMDGVHALAKGLNHVSKTVWDKFKTHPTGKALLEAGHASEVEDEKPAKKSKKSEEE